MENENRSEENPGGETSKGRGGEELPVLTALGFSSGDNGEEMVRDAVDGAIATADGVPTLGDSGGEEIASLIARHERGELGNRVKDGKKRAWVVTGDPSDSASAEKSAKEPRRVIPTDVMTLDGPRLEHVGTTGLKLTHLAGLEVARETARELILRSNQLRTIEEVAVLEGLEFLEVYDNMIESLAPVGALRRLRTLDASYNRVREISFLEEGGEGGKDLLETAYIASNKVGDMSPVRGARNLVLLDLGTNRIREIQGLDGLESLQELWLGKNRITEISGLTSLVNLRKLDVQSNRLTEIQGLESLPLLEELYLGHNAIEQIQGLDALVNLRCLDLTGNHIARIPLDAFAHLAKLTDLWLSYNRIETFDDVLPPLQAHTPILDTLYLEHNPVAENFDYRMRLTRELPSLTQIDALGVRRD